jgi:hypothetical protein
MKAYFDAMSKMQPTLAQRAQTYGLNNDYLGALTFSSNGNTNPSLKDFTTITPQEQAANQQNSAEWGKMYLGSPAFNPSGANSYLISNSIGLGNASAGRVGLNSTTGTGTGTGTVTSATGSGIGNGTNTGTNQAETLQSNSIDLNKNRDSMFKRSNVSGYNNGAQYYQTPSLQGNTGTGTGSGYGGLGYSSANSGRGWGGGNNWNKAIWR